MSDTHLTARNTEMNRQNKILHSHGVALKGEADSYQDKYLLCWEVMSTMELKIKLILGYAEGLLFSIRVIREGLMIR